ncbi:hypothetical protein GCM10022631_07580 [Deinococcus rubellus]|uniref:DUF3060 domain-containing protein n=1 Tax=Deinococcus rubellus TaxID=1889240 RepID=UPI0031E51FF5
MNRLLLALLACAFVPAGSWAAAQSISIGPNGISLSGLPSSVRGQSSVNVQLDSSGLRVTTTPPRAATLPPAKGVTLASRPFDCRGRSVTVSGNDQRLTLLGSCASVIVKGNRNIIQVNRVGSISIQGSGNRVTWTGAISGVKPLLRLSGSGNVVMSARKAAPQPAVRPKPAAKPAAPPRTATRL